MTKCFLVVVYFLLGGMCRELPAATLPAGFSESTVNGPAGATWNQAVGMHFEDNGRLYVWEKSGRVWFKESGANTWTLLIDISEEVGNWDDMGMLGFALDPNFRVNGNLYLMYVVDRHYLLNFGTAGYNSATNDYNDATIGRITRYTARVSDGFTSVDYTTRQVLLGETKTNGIPILYSSHGLGSLVFGTDGTLLASCGEAASFDSTDIGSAAETYFAQALADGIIQPKENVGAYRSQLVDSLSGKILRLDPDTGDGLPSNPFYDPTKPRAGKSRVWALGVRNPYRMTLRPGTGSHVSADANPGVLYFGEVGYAAYEELNVCTGPGQNFGWPKFEGVTAAGYGYATANVPNLDAPNPRYPGSGCAQYFYFRELINQNTSVTANQPPFNNPCFASQKIPGALPQFLQTPPAIDWEHSSPVARTWIYDGSGVAAVINIGDPGSPISGSMFPGNCSIGGVWYSGSDFPVQYQNTYFHADYGVNWIKNFAFNTNDQPVAVAGFLTGGGGIVALGTHPIDGGLYYIDITASRLRKITYSVGGNLPPNAVATANTNYGPGPLAVQFTGSASTDPEGLTLTYNWNFGDGTPASPTNNPAHIFNAPAGVPTPYTVTLTVTDNIGQTAVDTLLISVNNTPPTVSITSPTNGGNYPMTGDTSYNLTATVMDAQSSDAQLLYEWQTFLHHNNHEHPDPVDTNHTTTTVIAPVGCDGNIYYYRIVLKVTDPAGLSTQAEAALYPDCPNLPPVAAFNATPTTGNPPLLVSFDASPSADPNGDPLTFSWAFGDGGTGSGATPQHTYSAIGDYTVTLTATDPTGLTNTASTTISVVPIPPLTITTSSLPGGLLNSSYSATLTASGGTQPYNWSLASGALPSGLTLNSVSGAITGTPTTNGNYNFTARVTDVGGPVQSVSNALSLVVTTAPTMATIGNTNEGALTDAMGASWINAGRFQASNNLTVTTMVAKVVAIAGKYKCAIYTDSGGQPSRLLRSSAEVSNPSTDWQTFALTAPQALTNGQYYWLAIWSDDASAQIYYSGTAGIIRWVNYTYGAWPDPIVTTGSASLNYCIYATGPAAPVATDMAVGMMEDTSTNLTLLGVGGAISYAIQSNPTNGVLGVLNTNTGGVSYTPNANYNGADVFRFTVSNGSQQATGTVSLTITTVNDAPTLALASNNVVVLEDSGVVTETSFAATTVGPANESGQSVTNIVVLSVSNATLFASGPAISTGGTLTFTPVANSNGVAAVTVQARDNGGTANSGTNGSGTQTFTITINAVNDAPVAADENYNLGGGVTLDIPAPGTLTNDSDMEGDSLMALLVSGPLQGALNLDPDGGFNYTPTNHFNGVDAFTYQASDGLTNSGPATVNIIVSNPIQITSIALSNGVVTLRWTAITGKSYRLQYKDSLTDASWTDLGPNVSAAGPSAIGTNAVATATPRFYRVLGSAN